MNSEKILLYNNSNILINLIQTSFNSTSFNNDEIISFISGGYSFLLYSQIENINLDSQKINLYPNDVDMSIYLNLTYGSGIIQTYPLFFLDLILNIIVIQNTIIYEYLNIYLILPIECHDFIFNHLIIRPNYLHIQSNYDKDGNMIEKFNINHLYNTSIKIILKIKFSNIHKLVKDNIYQISVIELKKNKEDVILPFEIVLKNKIIDKKYIIQSVLYNDINILTIKKLYLFYNLFHLYHKYFTEENNIQIKVKKIKKLVIRDYNRLKIIFINILNKNNTIHNINNSTECFHFLIEHNYIFKVSSEFIKDYSFLIYILKYFNLHNNFNNINNSKFEGIKNILDNYVEKNRIRRDEEQKSMGHENIKNKLKEVKEQELMGLENNYNMIIKESTISKEKELMGLENIYSRDVAKENEKEHEKELMGLENIYSRDLSIKSKKSKPKKKSKSKSKSKAKFNNFIKDEDKKTVFNKLFIDKIFDTKKLTKILLPPEVEIHKILKNINTNLFPFVVELNLTVLNRSIENIIKNSKMELFQGFKTSKSTSKSLKETITTNSKKLKEEFNDMFIDTLSLNNFLETSKLFIINFLIDHFQKNIRVKFSKNLTSKKISIRFLTWLNIVTYCDRISLNNINSLFELPDISTYGNEYNSLVVMEFNFNKELNFTDYSIVGLYYKILTNYIEIDKNIFYSDDNIFYEKIKEYFFVVYGDDINEILEKKSKDNHLIVSFNLNIYKTFNYFRADKEV